MWFPSRIAVFWSSVANSICHFNLLVLYLRLGHEEELVQ
ncbi:hypothetical protein A2U01_0084679, partial [Trifolium medium]|nr:hypothetical protein [Trifolium medium]